MQHLDEGTIHAWLDGALSKDEARQAEAHVSGCAECSGAVAEARGLIAASSMILSKLDGGLGAEDGDARAGIGVPAPHDLAAARAVAKTRQGPARRNRFATPGLRAAAAVLVLAAGVAAVRNTTKLDDLARVVADASPDAISPRQAGAVPEAVEAVVQDATAAAAEQAPVAPPPPTVGPAPALPRPAPVVGGMTPPPRAGGPGIGSMTPTRGEGRPGVGGMAAASHPGGPVSASKAGRPGTEQGYVAEIQATDLRPERDFSVGTRAESAPAPASLAASAPAVTAPAEVPPVPARANGVVSPLALRRLADSVHVQREALGRLGEDPAARQRFSAPAPVRAGIAAEAFSSAAPDGAARCYALTLSPWSPEAATIPGAPATRIVLSGDTGTAGPSAGQRLVRPMPGAFAGSYDDAWYTEVSPSTLVITWATGTEGIVMRLVRSGEVLAGTARTFGAAGNVERTSSVHGEQVDCGDGR